MRTKFEKTNLITYGMPDLCEFQKLRAGFDHQDIIYSMKNRAPLLFYGWFLPCVGSIKNYMKMVFQSVLSKMYSVSQEGYILLELSNNYKLWMTNALKKYKHPDDIINEVPTQYQSQQENQELVLNNKEDQRTKTGGQRSTKWTHSRYYTTMDGWSEEGMANYNKYCLYAKTDRKNSMGISFEAKFLKQMRDDKKIGNCRNNQISTFVQPYNDLWGDCDNEMENTVEKGDRNLNEDISHRVEKDVEKSVGDVGNREEV